MPNSFPTQLYLSFILIITLLLSSPGVYSATFTITNKCSYPVWPGLYSNPGNSQLPTTGFALQPGKSNNVSIPESWSGRVWGRTFCTQSATTGNFSCLTGNCASSTVQCSGNSISNPPATLAEFALNSFNGIDFYDISLVDGYNLPMLISPRGHRAGNCSVIGCVVNLNPACPAELSVVDSSDGETVACKSACLALGDKSQYCCTTSANCTATPYSSFFKVACPQAYSYALDDQTSTFTCSEADYVITFCPNNSNTSSKGDNCTTTSNGQTKCVDTTGDTKNATNTSVDTKNATNTSVDTKKGDKFAGWKLGLAVSLPGVGILFVTVYCFMRKQSSSYLFHWRKAKNHTNIETLLKKHGSLAPTIYTYTQVKKMTNSFNNKLGQGGFGTVFKGKLPDSREVAVKVLKESKKDGEEFINEVASISRTSHVNVVSLLGFSFEGSKRALVYEYMPNGSLEKYIYQENPSGADRQLGWEALYQIALGIARGLEYLHRGCNTRILHFDIKPHNILLDEKFCPKISDFGLARVCPEEESIISKVTARGTPGYTAPEFFLRNLGGISHKSDVYSYGLLVLEMVGGRRNLCIGVDKTSEIYFPGWVHKRLVLDEELGLPGISHEEENQISRKLILVSMWCIQTSPSDRPSMGRVVEMLQGSLESLQIPPRPYLSSPSRSPDRSVANS